MVHRIVYHPNAEAELDKLYSDIGQRVGSLVAGRFIDGLLTFIEGLAPYPERGTLRQSRVPGLRIIGYRRSISVAFSVREADVLILGVFAHGRDVRDDLLAERDE